MCLKMRVLQVLENHILNLIQNNSVFKENMQTDSRTDGHERRII